MSALFYVLPNKLTMGSVPATLSYNLNIVLLHDVSISMVHGFLAIDVELLL